MIRILDLLISTLALMILAPILLPIVVILRLTGEGEVLYVQQRVGFAERHFGLYKFATMLKNSPNMGTGTITLRHDPRVLPVGRLLRKTKVNELPQLLNVLCGSMSLIGPRPLTDNHFKHYSKSSREAISSVKPGLSGVGSIIFRDEERLLSSKKDPSEYYKTEIAPYKAALEAWYVENRSLRLYVICVFLTAWVVLFPSSQLAYSVLKELPIPEGQLKLDLDSLN